MSGYGDVPEATSEACKVQELWFEGHRRNTCTKAMKMRLATCVMLECSARAEGLFLVSCKPVLLCCRGLFLILCCTGWQAEVQLKNVVLFQLIAHGVNDGCGRSCMLDLTDSCIL